MASPPIIERVRTLTVGIPIPDRMCEDPSFYPDVSVSSAFVRKELRNTHPNRGILLWTMAPLPLFFGGRAHLHNSCISSVPAQ